MARTLYCKISELITNHGVALKKGVGVNAEDLGIMRDGALLWDSRAGILWMGAHKKIPRSLARGAKSVSLKGKTLAPAFADCHTHFVFGGSRHNELAMRLAGKTYQQIAASGGGIASSVKATRAASEDELYAAAYARLGQARRLGVGLIEMKSGYGLNWAAERKQLRVVARLKRQMKGRMTIQSTFLGAHAFPPEARTPRQRAAYVDEVVEQMIPAVTKERLADACDVFFDEGYYNEAQSRRILSAARAAGLAIKLHADELADTGGAALAAELGALSADHLLKANEKNLKQMARAGVVAVLLPTTALYLGLDYAPLDRLRRAEVCLALASDFNPGTSPAFHMPFVVSLACLEMGMTMPEAFAAATYGSARAMGYHEQHGHLAVGMKPRLAIFNCPSYEMLISQVAHPGLCDNIL